MFTILRPSCHTAKGHIVRCSRRGDDFEAEPARQWHKVVPTFVFENGVLKGTQTRDKDQRAADGNAAVAAHAAVHGLDVHAALHR